MNVYSIALFLHIVGAVLLFVALTVEGVALRQGARGLLNLNRLIGPISAVTVLIPGLYMTATLWGPAPWILGGLVSWLLLAAVGTVTGIRLTRIDAEIGPLAATSWWLRTGLAIGVLFLMTVKPGVVGTVLAIVVAALAGAGVGLAAWRRAGIEGKPA
jgi:hypothetical protein